MSHLVPCINTRCTHTLLPLLVLLLVWTGCSDQQLPTETETQQTQEQHLRVDPQLDTALQAQARHTDDLMNRPGVVGTAIRLNKGGKPSIVVYALSEAMVRKAELPAHVDGIPVTVEITGMFVARSDETSRQRPAPIGFSVGHPNITAGTIGARVKDSAGNVYILSNNHVLADNNAADLGDSALQPGPYDGGTDPADRIGTLSDYEPISFSSNNTMDAAIALSSTGELGFSTPTDEGYGTPSATLYNLDGNNDGSVDGGLVGLQVQKYGRTTGHTHGEVSEINVTVDVCYECNGPYCFSCKRSARFVDQIAITPGTFSDGGDSGSLIVADDGTNQPVGLLYAGSDTRTLANRIDLVLERFNVTIDDGSDSGDTDSPPSVSITSPSDGEEVAGTVTITADASDDNSVVQVEFFADGASIGTDTEGNDGWSTTWDSGTVSDGSHTLTATATDGAGQSASDQVNVTVNNDSGGSTLALTANGYKVRGLQKADLSWSGATSADVDLYRDGTKIITTANDGAYTDDIDQRGGGSYTYEVCEAGTSTCSNEATVTF